MPQSTPKKLHVPLPPELHAELKIQAERLGAPATAIAREAITAWLHQRRREEIANEIRAYAEEVAGSDHDLDEDLERAATAALTEAPV